MKYCIYKGDLYQVTEATASTVFFRDDFGSSCAPAKNVVEVTEADYKAMEEEIITVRQELRSLKERMYKLDEAYREKSEALRRMMMDARQKEISIVNRLIKASMGATKTEFSSNLSKMAD